MRRDLPILWKYLLVVAATCALVFVIAQNDAAAQAASSPYRSAGSHAVQVTESTWRDVARTRDVPVRLYAPKPDDHRDATRERFPVILFSHGLGGSRDGGKFWAAHWASHGYLVIAMQHPGSDESLWKNDAPGDIRKNLKSGISIKNLSLRVGDVRFVIDEVIRRTASGEKDFANADPKRLGMSGHSFGAQTTLAVAGQKAGILGGQSGLDTRVVSAVVFSPNARDKVNVARQFGDIRIPLFSVTGTRDGSILGDGTRYQDRMQPYENMPAGGKYLVVFDGGDHMVFGGHELSGRRPETARDREIQAGVKAATLAFWDATLKADQSARTWLESGGFKSTLNASDSFASK